MKKSKYLLQKLDIAVSVQLSNRKPKVIMHDENVWKIRLVRAMLAPPTHKVTQRDAINIRFHHVITLHLWRE